MSTNKLIATARSDNSYATDTVHCNEYTSSKFAVHMIKQKQNKARKEMNLLVAQHPSPVPLRIIGKTVLKLTVNSHQLAQGLFLFM